MSATSENHEHEESLSGLLHELERSRRATGERSEIALAALAISQSLNDVASAIRQSSASDIDIRIIPTADGGER